MARNTIPIAKVAIPECVIGFDCETKDTLPTAYPLSFAAVVFDIARLAKTHQWSGAIDPNDPKMQPPYFTESKSTLDWWWGKLEYSQPDECARKAAWSGTAKLPDVLKEMIDGLEFIRHSKRPYVITTRGPEFDIPIVTNCLNQCDIFRGVFNRFSLNDSDRTAERMLAALGMEMDISTESVHWQGDKMYVAHMPEYDAGMSAYRTARAYHLLKIIREHGSDKAYEINDLMRSLDYNPTTYWGK